MALPSTKDDPIKINLSRLLNNIVEDIQLSKTDKYFLNFGDNTSNNLSIIIEAIFLHGLKSSIIHKTRNLFFQDFDDHPPIVDFWNLALTISHKEIIKQIDSLKFIRTEIGKCRVWIRKALQDSMLSSYFNAIRINSNTASKYYNESAFLRDEKLVDFAENSIKSIEKITNFQFNLNSSLLNSWSSKTLTIAGILNRAVKPTITTEIDTAIDIVENINQVEKKSDTLSISFNSNRSLSIEDGVVDKTLSTEPTSSFKVSNEPDVLEILDSNLKNDTNDDNTYLNEKNVEENEQKEENDNSDEINTNVEDKNDFENEDYFKLLNNYKNTTGFVQLKNYVEEIQNELIAQNSNETVQNQDEDDEYYKKYMFKIPRNYGLDKQNFKCNKCKCSIIKKRHLCHFTKTYYCDFCIDTQLYCIPARIIYNWDFTKYSISKDAANFLQKNQNQPLFDCEQLNPLIYEKVQIMSQVFLLRKRLVQIGAYLFNCRNIENFDDIQTKVPNQYIYTNINLYSLKDFESIYNGAFIKTYTKILKEHITHVMQCFLCTQKGFICEICKKNHVIFPFDYENTFLCPKCGDVFHKKCYQKLNSCLKCKRRKIIP